MRSKPPRFVLIAIALMVFAGALYYFPPVHERLAWRVDNLRAQIKYFFNPPEEVTFLPGDGTPVAIPTETPAPTLTATPTPAGPTETPFPSATPTITPTPIPTYTILTGIKYEDQHNRWNYCGPANFSMSLTYWGWTGNRDTIGRTVKPNDKDKNVMPYEFQNYVQENVSGMNMILRMGGDIELLKRLIAAGFPVVVEKGYYEADYTGKVGWLGHYLFTTGYDDTQGVFITQDTYLRPGKDRQVKYADYYNQWRSFNFLFAVIYPVDREEKLMQALGPYADQTWAVSHALEVAQREANTLNGVEKFFAQYNIGTSWVELFDYGKAAQAYDAAFDIYNKLPDDGTRPYRMLWYQTGPYKAYYFSGYYERVLSLANTTLQVTISEPTLEESLYWRGMAERALGDTTAAIDDFRAALLIHPDFLPVIQAMQDMGVQP